MLKTPQSKAKPRPSVERPVRMVAIARLKPFPGNPRKHTADQLGTIGRLLREYGWTRPILVDENRTILAGHGTIEAARMIGKTHAPCIEIDGLSLEQKRAYVVADNKSAELSTWDDSALALQFREITAAAPSFDMTLTGFELPEIETRVQDLTPPPPAPKSKLRVNVTVECPHCHKTFERK